MPANWSLQTTLQLLPANWQTVAGATPPYLVATTNPQAYFRIRQPQGGLMTFAEYIGNPHNTQVPVGTVLTNGLAGGLTATVGGASGGFGVNSNSVTPPSVVAPTLFVWGDSTGSSLVFSSPVTVPSLWTSAPAWALANDPGGQQRITGKLNGATVWAYTNTTASTSYFEVTNGIGKSINELVIYPKWIAVDNVRVQ
jgi:hypothetical protein